MSTRSYDQDACEIDAVDPDAVARAAADASPDGRVHATVSIFSALADPTRFRILEALAVTELCVCDIAAAVDASQSAVSHQLRLLRDRGLVSFRRDGQRAVYRLADDHVRTLIDQGLEHADERGDVR